MKGYSAVSTQVMLPSNGAGVVHDFVLPCTTCQDEHGQAEMKVAYIEEVKFFGVTCMVCDEHDRLHGQYHVHPVWFHTLR